MNDSPEIGFTPIPTIMWPLPYRKTSHFTREAYGLKCTYSSSDVVPYTRNDRLWLEVVTTALVRAKNNSETDPRNIEFARVSEELEKIGQPGENRYIQSARNSILRVYRLALEFSQDEDLGAYQRFRGFGFRIGEALDLTWAKGRTENDKQLSLPGTNRLMLSEAFERFILTERQATPHIREHYHALEGPKQQDIYRWLILSLHKLTKPRKVKREWLIQQFWGPVSPDASYKHWITFKRELAAIIEAYYPAAKVELIDEGLKLKPSDPLIEPDSRKAGFLL